MVSTLNRKFFYCILICLFITSCAPSKSFKSIKYKFEEDSVISVSGRVPKNYVDAKKMVVHNETFDIEYLYIYGDSSIVYISNAKTFAFPNYDNIKNIDSEDARLRLQNDYYIAETNKILAKDNIPLLPRSPYNITFSGVDKNGLFWKDIKYGNVSIGYKGVLEVNKQVFDNALTSFEVK